MNEKHFTVSPVELVIFKQKALRWAQQFRYCAFYENNQISYPNSGFRNLLAVSNSPANNLDQDRAFESLEELLKKNTGWLFGMLSYDLKNQVEELESRHPDHINFPLICFFKPDILIEFEENSLKISSNSLPPTLVFSQIQDTGIPKVANQPVQMQPRISKEDYINNVEKIRQHIEAGDVYEMNYCMEFFAEKTSIDPLTVFERLNEKSPMPFAGFYKQNDTFLLCASPERFLKKEGDTLLSQPIKGTIRRGSNPEEDEKLRHQLRNDEKELAENLMIVDLVRNDLARVSETGSVKVEELFGIYGFQHVFQMISTISSKKRHGVSIPEILKATFPMGSMTGAPKIRVMQLIEQYEKTKRGLYSGSIGYITPGQDFDFNVVIRSLQYNQPTGYLNFEVGSAITYDSVPEQEYEECLLKAKAMFGVLG